ncbi:uncharacterized protein [Chelonus insularis]|uniref:uncharacterized protein n=1 Tax=Chelonus insularis TaxID=460826 RepID=UPI00158CCF35|nr:uncharacterized protein LOC118066264 [Chelonus insularis]
MANVLRRSFQYLNIAKTSLLISKYSTAFNQDLNKNYFPPFLHESSITSKSNYEPNLRVSAVPSSNIVDLGLPQGIYRKIIDTPIMKIPRTIIDPLTISILPKEDKISDKSFNLPTPEGQIEKKAHRMIRIRRRKMKNHKLKKWRRKYKTLYFNKLQRKWLRKEKEFRAEILAKIKAADEYDAKAYVASRLAILDNVRFPHTYKGYLLPEAQIRQLMKEDEEKYNAKHNPPKLTL